MAQEGAVSSAPTAPADRLNNPTPRRGLIEKAAARSLISRLGRLRHGRLDLVDGPRRESFGSITEELPVAARVEVHDPRFYRSVALGGSIGAAEAYADGLWDVDDLTALIRIFSRNEELLSGVEGGLALLRRPLSGLAHAFRANTRVGSRKNIAAHYDLGNEFFSTFLDPTMMYSCAVFPDESSSLEAAQIHKVDRLCRKLDLQPGDRVLEIGSGWGYFAQHAAGVYGCNVVTTTISRRQQALVERRLRTAGLGDRVTVLALDYRDLAAASLGRYDKLVSIEMIEAVGHRYLPLYFETISEMLEPHGLAAIQAIVIADQRYDDYRRSVDFIQRHIFPGGLLPSVARMSECIRQATDLRLMDLEDITAHYPETLRRWRESFLRQGRRLEEMGMDSRFQRLWDYYFCYCEGGFLERVIGDVQLLLAKPLNRRPPLAMET
jgi:cyclopropane-fatty-acyl-phospholipid synthase